MTPGQRRRPFPWADEWPEIHDDRVRAAFGKLQREAFVEEAYRQWADRDAPLPIGEGQTISQPFVVALMTQALHLGAGQKVLEIGTGSGFQTAVLCELTAAEDHTPGETVYSIERYDSLSERAGEILFGLGYAPHLCVGDGAAGWRDASPFDAIIVTAAARCLPKPLWEQLKLAGRMVIPIGGEYSEQTLWRLQKAPDAIQGKSLGPVRFVPLVSRLLDDPEQCVKLPFRSVRSL